MYAGTVAGILEVIDRAEKPWAIEFVAANTVSVSLIVGHAERQLESRGWSRRDGDWTPPTRDRLAYQVACKEIFGQDLSFVTLRANGIGLHYACKMEVARAGVTPAESLGYALIRMRDGKSIVP